LRPAAVRPGSQPAITAPGQGACSAAPATQQCSSGSATWKGGQLVCRAGLRCGLWAAVKNSPRRSHDVHTAKLPQHVLYCSCRMCSSSSRACAGVLVDNVWCDHSVKSGDPAATAHTLVYAGFAHVLCHPSVTGLQHWSTAQVGVT
jgi:hypothetical protein